VRRAFTLMELMVSIVLIALIVLFLFGAIASSKVSNDTLAKHTQKERLRSELFELLYRDIMEALSIQTRETKERKFTVLQMQTANSLYEIARPYVTYFVHSRTHMLTRLESAHEIQLPIAFEEESFVMADTLLSDVTAFNVYGKSKEISEDNNESDSRESNSSESNNTSMENNTTAQGTLEGYLIYIDTPQFKNPFLFELYR